MGTKLEMEGEGGRKERERERERLACIIIAFNDIDFAGVFISQLH
jgi:hypothetical protein